MTRAAREVLYSRATRPSGRQGSFATRLAPRKELNAVPSSDSILALACPQTFLLVETQVPARHSVRG